MQSHEVGVFFMNTAPTTYWLNPFNSKHSIEERLFFLLRFGVLGCFVGHGAWGLMLKAGWLTFFNVFYIPESYSWPMMPIVGLMDITVGILAFYRPTRALLLWAAIWTIFTAALRPAAGLGMSEFFERAGNYGIPLAFLWITGGIIQGGLWKKTLTPSDLKLTTTHVSFEFIMRLMLALLLIGHGGLAFFNDHPVLIKHFNFLGVDPTGIYMRGFGLFEMLLGMAVYMSRGSILLMWLVFAYKLGTELIHPIAGHPKEIFETIERMGDYILPMLLIVYYQYYGSKHVIRNPFTTNETILPN